MVAPLSSWPWENFGVYKYLLYGPLVANVLYTKPWDNSFKDSWCLHILVLCALRVLVYQLWCSFSCMFFFIRRRRILKDGVDFKQIDNEWDWDNSLILQAFMATLACYLIPNISNLPIWNINGLPIVILLHVLMSEPFFYCAHRLLHEDYLFKSYHFLHHSSPVPQPFTAGFATPLEHILMGVVMSLPILGSYFMGFGSIGLIYGYVLLFDFARCLGHCNVEVFPHKIFQTLPFLKYLIYTPTYHTLHHIEKNSNFCLFMPLFDVLGGTLNSQSWELQKEFSSGMDDQVPDFVFLAHIVDLMHSLHSPFVFRSFAAIPYTTQIFSFVLLPNIAVPSMLVMWAWSKTFVLAFYKLRGMLHQTWMVPRFGFHYFLPFATDGINKQIELAILRGDKMGVKVISLAALNKNEALNGGGTLFVNKHPDLKVRVVHGNTLTAAVILNEIHEDVKEVFLTGATSKLGRAIALYLCRKKVRVMMLTLSTERFQKIVKEAPAYCQQYLIQVTKYEAAQNCKTWIVGKWTTPREQRWAPPGTHFHQFVVPQIFSFRRDCTYGELAAMKLPEDVQGLGMCEYTMERGVVHACHAGGVVHFLEGWGHHEVGAIDVDRIDVVWAAALKHGLKPVN